MARRPVEAITRQQDRATQNRKKIADAIAAAQTAGDTINVSAIAARAGVDPGTVRNNPELLNEIIRLRDNQTARPRTSTQTQADAASYKEMQARWLTAQSENADLRKQLKQAETTAHQALGITAALVDPDELKCANERVAELEIQVMNLRQAQTETNAQLHDTVAELTDSRELNREYLRQLEQVQRDLQRAKRLRAGVAASKT
ncbi:MAG: hypothetical protein HQ526_04130 [Actinobacteria bacterium]|nr:hypothetical protein [Actinomycetota bacterium]